MQINMRLCFRSLLPASVYFPSFSFSFIFPIFFHSFTICINKNLEISYKIWIIVGFEKIIVFFSPSIFHLFRREVLSGFIFYYLYAYSTEKKIPFFISSCHSIYDTELFVISRSVFVRIACLQRPFNCWCVTLLLLLLIFVIIREFNISLFCSISIHRLSTNRRNFGLSLLLTDFGWFSCLFHSLFFMEPLVIVANGFCRAFFIAFSAFQIYFRLVRYALLLIIYHLPKIDEWRPNEERNLHNYLDKCLSPCVLSQKKKKKCYLVKAFPLPICFKFIGWQPLNI